MTLNTTRARKQLAKGELRSLFIEELGLGPSYRNLAGHRGRHNAGTARVGPKTGHARVPVPHAPRPSAYPITTAAGRSSAKLPGQRTST